MTTDNFTEFTEVFNKAWDDSFSDIPGEITYSIIFNKEKEKYSSIFGEPPEKIQDNDIEDEENLRVGSAGGTASQYSSGLGIATKGIKYTKNLTKVKTTVKTEEQVMGDKEQLMQEQQNQTLLEQAGQFANAPMADPSKQQQPPMEQPE